LLALEFAVVARELVVREEFDALDPPDQGGLRDPSLTTKEGSWERAQKTAIFDYQVVWIYNLATKSLR
jgi:hypothetical protein